MFNNRKIWFLRFFILAWLLASFAVMGAMYHLWWGRERAMYWGLDTAEKRESVFRYVGFPPTLLDAVNTIQNLWPDDTCYSIKGDANTISYPVYLLIPRIPVGGNTSFRLILGESAVPVSPEYVVINPDAPPEFRIVVNNTGANKLAFVDTKPQPIAFLLAVFCIIGVGLLAESVLFRRTTLDLPDSISVGLITVAAAVCISKYGFGSIRPGGIVVVLCALAGWIWFLVRHINRIPDIMRGPKEPARWRSQSVLDRSFVILALVLIASVFLWSMLKTVIVVPDVWDCWAIWGAKAKMLALGRGPVSDTIQFGQRDYPLLWPSIWAFNGWLAGGWEEQWSKGWGPVLMLVCIAEIGIIVRRETNRPLHGLLAGCLFASIPIVPVIAAWGYAEPVLWCMVTCSFGALLRWRKSGRGLDLALAGLLAAGSALTKNEGLVFVCLSCLWVAAHAKLRIGALFCFVLPVLALYVPWFCLLRLSAGVAYDSMPPLLLPFDQLCLRISRLLPALKAALPIWFDVRQWSFVLWGLMAWAAVAMVRGSWKVRSDLIIPMLMLVASFSTIILRNDNFEWQVGAAWNRLTVQVLPLVIISLVSWGVGGVSRDEAVSS